MASENAKAVAKEVSETIRLGKKVILGKIIAKRYSKSTSEAPQRVTNTKSYKEAISPIVEAMEKERNRLILALAKKKLSKEKYRDMIDGLDKLTKNIQLLNGGKTSNDGIKISWEN